MMKTSKNDLVFAVVNPDGIVMSDVFKYQDTAIYWCKIWNEGTGASKLTVKAFRFDKTADAANTRESNMDDYMT